MTLDRIYTEEYNLGIKNISAHNYIAAKRNLLKATEALLTLAKESSGVKKANYIKRANDINVLINEVNFKLEKAERINTLLETEE